MLHVNDQITIEDWELTELFIRASGPGGQNVNKIATAVERPNRRIPTKPPPRRQDPARPGQGPARPGEG